MTNDLQFTLSVNAAPEKIFKHINNVTKWWTENLEGSSQKLNDEFSVQFWDIHYSKQKLVEFVPNKKVTWLVTESQLTFIEDQNEWTNTRISFEIVPFGKKTEVRFTHHGLNPKVECFEACSNGWTDYIKGSLLKLITTGKGRPTLKSDPRPQI